MPISTPKWFLMKWVWKYSYNRSAKLIKLLIFFLVHFRADLKLNS
jgi:hypothetical protein